MAAARGWLLGWAWKGLTHNCSRPTAGFQGLLSSRAGQPPSAAACRASQGGPRLIFQSISRGLLLFGPARPGLCVPGSWPSDGVGLEKHIVSVFSMTL